MKDEEFVWLSPTIARLLLAVYERGGTMFLSQLQKMASSVSIEMFCIFLEKYGLGKRERFEADKRVKYVKLTEKGMRVARLIYELQQTLKSIENEREREFERNA